MRYLGGVLIFGVGLEAQHAVCSAAIYLCIAFYATSKILIYFYLSKHSPGQTVLY